MTNINRNETLYIFFSYTIIYYVLYAV